MNPRGRNKTIWFLFQFTIIFSTNARELFSQMPRVRLPILTYFVKRVTNQPGRFPVWDVQPTLSENKVNNKHVCVFFICAVSTILLLPRGSMNRKFSLGFDVRGSKQTDKQSSRVCRCCPFSLFYHSLVGVCFLADSNGGLTCATPCWVRVTFPPTPTSPSVLRGLT